MSVTLLPCEKVPVHALRWLPARHSHVSGPHPHEHLLPRLHRCPPPGHDRRSCQLRHQPAFRLCLSGPLHGAARRLCLHCPPHAARRRRRMRPHHSVKPRLGRRRRRLPRCLMQAAVQTGRLPRLQRRPGRRRRGRRRERRLRRRCFQRRRRPRGLLRRRASRRRRPPRPRPGRSAAPPPVRPAAAPARPPRTRAARRGPPRSPR
jgi:hypothetical protein